MFFTNLLLYRLTQPLAFDQEALEKALDTKRARPPASQELNTYGFVAPIGKGDDAPLVHHSHGFTLIATRKEERNLPSGVVRDAVKEKVDAIEAEQLRKVYRKERDQIKDEVIQELLPRAFIRRSSLTAAIDVKAGLILVNTSSPARAEDLLSTLREVLGSLPVRPVTVRIAPPATMTSWLQTEETPADFFALDRAVLSDTHEDGGSIKATRQDLTSEEIRMHLATGKIVTSLALAWAGKLSFVLSEKMAITGLRFEDLLKDKANADGGDDAAGQLDASFVLMMLTFRDFVPALLEALGGEETPQGI